ARLLAEHRVRYLDCEGGHTVLAALRGAGVLDEVFLTVTPFVVDASAHDGVVWTFDFEAEGAALIAEGRRAGDGGRSTSAGGASAGGSTPADGGRLQRRHTAGVGDQAVEVQQVERLRQIPVGAGAQRLLGDVQRVVPGHDENRHGDPHLAQRLQQADTPAWP